MVFALFLTTVLLGSCCRWLRDIYARTAEISLAATSTTSSAKFSSPHTHCVEPARYSAVANRNSPLWFGSRFGEAGGTSSKTGKTVTLLRTTQRGTCRGHGLKIRVSAVRFCPWPPVFKRLSFGRAVFILWLIISRCLSTHLDGASIGQRYGQG